MFDPAALALAALIFAAALLYSSSAMPVPPAT